MRAAAAFRHDDPGTAAEAWDGWVSAAAPLRLVDRVGAGATRVVVVAAHPDDEVLGAGGLLAVAARAPGVRVTVVLLTSGEASHPGSPTHDPERLAVRREAECRAGLAELGPGIRLVRCGLPDGHVASYVEAATASVVEEVGDGRGVLLVAPWRRDGHADHEAAGRAAAAAAVRTGARLLEYPVWWWHWGDPAASPPDGLTALPVDGDAAARKARAVGRHGSQLAPLSDQPGDERLLSPAFLAHFRRSREVFVEEPAEDLALDELHAGVEEPWGADSRWYEERKRALLLALLPSRRFRHALDVGCSTGVATVALADRCDAVVGIDASAAAVRAARERVAPRSSVVVERRRVPAEWPAGRFDLVVVSEVGYFLSPTELDGLADRLAGCLADGAVVVLAHWRHPVTGWPLDGADVHRVVVDRWGGEPLATYHDRDVELLLLGGPDALPEPLR